MSAVGKRIVFTAFALALLAGSSIALVHDRNNESPLQADAFTAPERRNVKAIEAMRSSRTAGTAIRVCDAILRRRAVSALSNNLIAA